MHIARTSTALVLGAALLAAGSVLGAVAFAAPSSSVPGTESSVPPSTPAGAECAPLGNDLASWLSHVNATFARLPIREGSPPSWDASEEAEQIWQGSTQPAADEPVAFVTVAGPNEPNHLILGGRATKQDGAVTEAMFVLDAEGPANPIAPTVALIGKEDTSVIEALFKEGNIELGGVRHVADPAGACRTLVVLGLPGLVSNDPITVVASVDAPGDRAEVAARQLFSDVMAMRVAFELRGEITAK